MKFLLLDGNSFCYRAFYAIRELRNSKGEPTNAVYGFITMLEKLLKEFEPDGAAVVFDMKGPTFRHEKFEDYKVHRTPMPDDLVFQMPIIREAVEAMNVAVYGLEGYEADDVLATLAQKLEKEGHEAFIVTGDKDLLQLVTKKIKVINPQKDNFVYDVDAVKARYGVGPEGVVEIMALMGDAVDNIPGVPGIGDKTASKLIQQYKTVKNLYKHIDDLPANKMRESLVKHKAEAEMSHELATAHCDVPIKFKPADLVRREPQTDKLIELYKRLEFRTLLKNAGGETKHEVDDSLKYALVNDKKAFDALVEKLAAQKEWSFDFETTGVDALRAEPLGISFSWKDKEAYYVAFRTAEEKFLSAKDALEKLKPLFENPKIKKIGQNIKYEAMVLERFGIRLKGIAFDTMVASYLLNTSKPNHNLDDIAMEHLQVRITDFKELIGTGKTAIRPDQIPLDKLYKYGCQDSDVTRRIAKILGPKLEDKEQTKLFEDIEIPLISVLADIESAGVAIDTKFLAKLSAEMEDELGRLTKAIHKTAGQEFNISSPKQLGEILFDKLGLPVVKKTKTGASTDSEVLEKLAEVHPLPKDILKFRELSKLKGTYVDALPELVNPDTGRVHTSFNQTVTATGRLSSSDPNLQNIPVRTEEGRRIRRAFTAGEKGSELVSADYSQIELRILAHVSEDKNLIEAFNSGADIHRYTAALIFNVTQDEVTDSMRYSAKTVNFGVLYGMGPFSLAKQLDITQDAAKDFIKAYFDRYPRVKRYLDETLEFARKHGFVETVFKRRRYIPEIASKDGRFRSFAERTATNAPLQGTASDVIKIAMNAIAAKLREEKFKSKMILQVHDELLFDGPKAEQAKLVKLVRQEMEGAVKFKVPMDVSIAAGPNWLEMEDVE